jgi:hypothetical protein
MFGAVWWDLRKGAQEQHHVNDRFGYHYAVMGFGVWPLLYLMMSDAWDSKTFVERDIQDGLYTKSSFVFSHVNKLTHLHTT